MLFPFPSRGYGGYAQKMDFNLPKSGWIFPPCAPVGGALATSLTAIYALCLSRSQRLSLDTQRHVLVTPHPPNPLRMEYGGEGGCSRTLTVDCNPPNRGLRSTGTQQCAYWPSEGERRALVLDGHFPGSLQWKHTASRLLSRMPDSSYWPPVRGFLVTLSVCHLRKTCSFQSTHVREDTWLWHQNKIPNLHLRRSTDKGSWRKQIQTKK
jgi:hypothetical protein